MPERSGPPEFGHCTPDPSYGWTIETLRVYNEALRREHEKFETERDRRYGEVKVEQEKAIKIKETADLAALELAREIQTYKDEQHNGVLEQLKEERGTYATKDDLAGAVEKIGETIKPLADTQNRESGGRTEVIGFQNRQIALVGVIATVVYLLVHYHP